MAARRVCVVALVAAAAITGSAQAGPTISLEHATRTARPGQTATAIVHVAGAERCRLRAGNARKAVELAGGTRVRYRFTVAQTARAGRHAVTISCDGASVAYKLTVRRSARGTTASLVAGRISALVFGHPVEDEETLWEPGDDLEGRPGRRPIGRPVGQPGAQPVPQPAPSLPPPTTSPDSPEVTRIWLNEVKPLFEAKTGECTQWAYEKRPEVVERAERLSIARWLDTRQPNDNYMLAMALASAWADGARAAGLPVDQTPSVGAIMVEPGNPGHVAYVEAVGADQFGEFFQVTEMNAPQKGVVTARTIDAAAVAAQGLQFIH
jgi:hypothetical protein